MKQISKQKRPRKLTTAGKRIITFSVLVLLLITLKLYNMNEIKSMNNMLQEQQQEIVVLQTQNENQLGVNRVTEERMESLVNLINDNLSSQPVIFTHYSTDDGSGVSETSSSGLGPKDFTTNGKGWYLYKGHVVVAHAIPAMGEVYSGYRQRKLWDVFPILVDGDYHTAIVLDTGSAMLGVEGETEQRIDIWIDSAEYGFGKVTGFAYE